MATATDDPLPAYMFASWLSFLIPASYTCVHGPDIVAEGLLSVSYLIGRPMLADTDIVMLTRKVSGVSFVLISAVLFFPSAPRVSAL